MTRKIEVNDAYYEKEVQHLGEIIRRGGLVAFPTETVYGLGGMPWTAKRPRKFMRQKVDLRIIL